MSGRGGGLEAALRALQRGNVDIRVLKETKLTQGIHTRNGSGYDIWEMEVESWHQGRGGVAVVWIAKAG